MSNVLTTRWWWLRHAPVRGGDGMVYGWTDLPIEPPTAEEIQAVASALPKDAAWITSGLRRSCDTAALFAAVHPNAAKAIEERAFAEMNFGEWEGVQRDEILAEEQQEFWSDFVNRGPPGGESFGDVVSRVVGAVERQTEAHSGRNIVVVGHSGSIKAALTLAVGVSAESTLAFVTDPLRITRLDHTRVGEDAHWSITMVNGLTA